MTEEHLLTESEIKIEEEVNGNELESRNSAFTPKTKSRQRSSLFTKREEKACPPSKSWIEYLRLEKRLQTYYCTQCSFETKWKCYLKNHIMKIHSTLEESRIYRCMQCKFKTKWKFSLCNHMKVHCAPDSLKMHKCPKCSYQTKWNNGLSSHMKVHVLPKVIKANLYKCGECSFESKNKLNLAQHTKMGHNPLQTIYKCPLCAFQTKFRHGVNKHVKVHNANKNVK